MPELTGRPSPLTNMRSKKAPRLTVPAMMNFITKISTAAEIVLAGLERLEQRAGGDAFSCLLRCTGVILLADYARALCEEAGAESLAWCTALAGRVLVLAAAWPLLEEIGQKIGSIAG